MGTVVASYLLRQCSTQVSELSGQEIHRASLRAWDNQILVTR